MKGKRQLYARLLMIFMLATVIELLFQRSLFILLIVGFSLVFLMHRRNKLNHTRQRSFLFWAGVVCIILAIGGTISFRIGVLIVLIVFIRHLLKMKRTADLISVQIKEAEAIHKDTVVSKNKIIGEYHFGESPFEWNDINIQFGIGDVIIDLGNTVLPPGENTAIIRGLVGDMRIVVPVDVGVALDYSAFSGQLNYPESDAVKTLRQETLVHYSENYHEATYKIKLVVSVIVGELEVMHV